jgi:hypothetical protein
MIVAIAGDFGLVGFWVGLAVWIADAWFGLAALRLGALWRWDAVALVVGSLLALTGIDRLGLTSQGSPTIFTQLSLTGIALNAVAWVILGLDIVAPGIRRSRTGDATRTVRPT